jgi:hypothetical protein
VSRFVLVELGDFDHGCSRYVSVRGRAGALTVGVAASNVVAVPNETSESPDVALAAQITIPILDIDSSPGPITITRQILLTSGAVPNRLFAELDSTAGTEYDLPGLNTNFQNTAHTVGELLREPGESIGRGLGRTTGGSGEWDLLGILGSSASDSGGSSFEVKGLTGGAEGIGAALGGSGAVHAPSRTVGAR